MAEPRVMLGINTLRNRKFVELPSDRARIAWLDLLFEAKIQKPEGTFASINHARTAAKHRREAVVILIDAGLLHVAPALCDRCKTRFGEVGATAVVMHDWHDYQEPSRWTKWRDGKRTDDAPPDAPAPAPDLHPTVHPPSHGGARASVSLSESESSLERTDGTSLNDSEDAVLVWLASVGATVQPNGNGHHKHLVTLVGRQGADAVIAAMKARYAAGDRSQAQLIYGAANELEPIHRPAGGKRGQAIQGDVEERIHAFKS